VLTQTRTYPSLTTFARLWQDERHTLLLVRPATGRRHQIRVHLAWIGHPVEGDPLFRGAGAPAGARTTVEAPPGADFWAPLRGRLPGGTSAAVLERARALDEPA
jgi:tRNA pseudouridine32 synthase / 23S rRNA pseudouridine746 synthase